MRINDSSMRGVLDARVLHGKIELPNLPNVSNDVKQPLFNIRCAG